MVRSLLPPVFNSNNGYVEDEVKELVGRMNDLGLGGNFVGGKGDGGGLDNGLGAIKISSRDLVKYYHKYVQIILTS